MTDIKDRSITWITGACLLVTFAMVGMVATADLLLTQAYAEPPWNILEQRIAEIELAIAELQNPKPIDEIYIVGNIDNPSIGTRHTGTLSCGSFNNDDDYRDNDIILNHGYKTDNGNLRFLSLYLSTPNQITFDTTSTIKPASLGWSLTCLSIP